MSKIKSKSDDPTPGDLIAIHFRNGEFELATGKLNMSPTSKLSCLMTLLNEVIFTIIDSLSYGFQPEFLNQDLKFLDMQKANELGNSMSVKVGPQRGLQINETVWTHFLTDVLGITLEFEAQMKTGGVPENPPSIYEAEAREAILQALQEVDLCSQLRNLKSQVAQRGQYILHLHDHIAELKQICFELKETIKRKDFQIKNIFGGISKVPTKTEKSKPKKPFSDFRGRDEKHHSTRVQNELDAALIRLLLRRGR